MQRVSYLPFLEIITYYYNMAFVNTLTGIQGSLKALLYEKERQVRKCGNTVEKLQ